MEQLEVDDEVFDDRGAPTRVVAATETMQGRPCYEVLLSDGSRFLADAAHQWVTTTKVERCRKRRRQLPRELSCTTEQLARTLRVGNE